VQERHRQTFSRDISNSTGNRGERRGQVMARELKAMQAAVGFRVKSGWATAVLLSGPIQTPQALARSIVDLSDPDVPESKQPYHAAMGMLEEDDAKIRQRTAVVQRVAVRSVTDLIQAFRAAGHTLRGAGLVVGSQVDPKSITNPHIRAHALEGRLFRSVLEDALQAHGLSCSVVVERDVYSKAAVLLARPEGELKRAVSALGHSLDGPWRAEEKLATLAAWMTLVGPLSSTPLPL
jgi:hypothetical protein